MATLIQEIETSSGTVFQKKEDSAGRTYYVKKGSGRVSQQAWAGATAHEETPWSESDAVSDDYHGQLVQEARRFSQPEYGVHIESYPVDERTTEITRQMQKMEGNYRRVYFQLKYRIVYDDGSTDTGFIRSKTISPSAQKQMKGEIRNKLDSLRQSMIQSPVDAVRIDRTDVTGLNYK